MTSGPRTLALATPHSAATDAGCAAFADGGTAVDAALAACATLTVVYPHMCSIGGDLIALVQTPGGDVVVVNGSGAAPAALDAARVRAALERDPAPRARTGMPERGPHAITVPGVLAAWETLAELGGALPLARRLQPAIALAAGGCPVAHSLAAALTRDAALLTADPGFSAVFFRDGRPLAEGEALRQRALAASLETIAAHGAGALYRGPVGARYVAGLRAAGSLLTQDDLAAHMTDLSSPLCGTVFEHEFLTAPPNSQGYALIEILLVMERLGGGSIPDPLGADAGPLARLFRLAGGDRDRHLCDPRVQAVPVEDLLGPDHVTVLAERSSRDTPLPMDRVATPPGPADAPASGDTIACVAADSDGSAVSVLQSVYYAFGAAILEPSTGIIAHDRGACFSLDPASPNVLEGGKRPAHTLMPVMVRRHGRLELVAGTRGGEAQAQIHAQILTRLLNAPAAGVAAAVAAPRWISGDGKVLAESGIPSAGRAALGKTGIPVATLGAADETVGHAQYLAIAADGAMYAASDPRSDGDAVADWSPTAAAGACSRPVHDGGPG